jgi:CRISPR-associated endoribonuclease Cas6
MRIPKSRFVEAGAADLINGYGSSYWRADRNHPLELFFNQLESNLRKKYDSYHGRESDMMSHYEPVFNSSRFLKQVAIEVPVTEKYRQTVIGTKWLFKFAGGNDLVRFAVDCGLGELNQLGFGFMNVQQQREVYN